MWGENYMDETLTGKTVNRHPKRKKKQPITWSLIKSQNQLIWMSVPLMLYIILFAYVPVWGWTMAFQDFKPAKAFGEQTWVGFKHFKFLFTDDTFLRVLRNTLAMGLINFFLGFITKPVP